MSEPSTLPRPAIIAATVVAVMGFFITIVLPAALPAKPAMAALPLMFVAFLWLVPLGLALLRGDRWAFVVAMAILLFLTDATFRSRSWVDKSWDWQVLLKGLTWAGCGLAGAVRLNRIGKILTTPPMVFALAFVLVMLASTAWSPSPSYTFLAGAGTICMVLFAAAAADILDDDDILMALALGTGLIVLPSLAMAPFTMGLSPPSPGATAESDRLRGMTDHPIPLAETSALFVFACVTLWWRRHGFGVGLLLAILAVAGTATALMTQSRLPVMALVAAAAGYWSFRKGGALLMAPVLLLMVVVVLAMESVSGFSRLLPHDLLEMVARSGSSKEILTLSGRLVIWPYVLEHIGEAPLIGHGHASGMLLFKGFTPWKISHAHNAVLQSLLYLGILGTIPLLLTVGAQLRVFVRSPSPVRDILMLFVLILGITEQSMVGNMPSQSAFLWLLAAAMAARVWRKR